MRDPEPTLRDLCRTIGEPFDPAMLNTSESADRVNATNEPWKAKVAEPVDASRAEAWREDLSGDELRLVDAYVGDRIRAYGYPVPGPEAPHYVEVPPLCRLDRYPEVVAELAARGARCWGLHGERPRLCLFLGDLHGWIGRTRLERYARTAGLARTLVRNRLVGVPTAWLGAPDRARIRGICAGALSRLLPPPTAGRDLPELAHSGDPAGPGPGPGNPPAGRCSGGPNGDLATRTGDPPLISVCMPVYNAERYLAQALESILNQTFGDFEFLILDDGSTDGSLGILERHARRDPRIRLTSRPNEGVAASLNELVDQSRGEFLARMDADDISLPERFARQVEYLRDHPECTAVGCRVWEGDTDGDPVGEFPTLGDHQEIDAFHFQMKGPALIHPSLMMRRDAVLAVGKYRDFPMEDLDLLLRLAEHGRLSRVPEFLLIYRLHSNNISYSKAHWERAYKSLCEILTETYRRRNFPETPPLPPPPAEPPGFERVCSYVWRSLGSGHPRTARKYARRALVSRPFSIDSWRLMYCALRGH